MAEQANMYLAKPTREPFSSGASDNYEIFLVDDSDDDAAFFQRVSLKTGFPLVLRRSSSAETAIRELARDKPDLIVLDCDMPGMGGIELLKELREMPHLSRTPIIMLSGTTSDLDLRSAYQLGINSFVVKAVEYEEYVEKVTSLIKYWLTVNCTDCKTLKR
jgi:CheY-like chemotaxis protein